MIKPNTKRAKIQKKKARITSKKRAFAGTELADNAGAKKPPSRVPKKPKEIYVYGNDQAKEKPDIVYGKSDVIQGDLDPKLAKIKVSIYLDGDVVLAARKL